MITPSNFEVLVTMSLVIEEPCEPKGSSTVLKGRWVMVTPPIDPNHAEAKQLHELLERIRREG